MGLAAYVQPETWDVDRPWLPQPCDSPDSYHWFLLYATALEPPRDVTRLVRDAGCPLPIPRLLGLETSCAWRERAEAYDAHLARVRLETIERETETLAQATARRMAAARAVTMLGAAEVERLARRAALTPDHPGSIAPELAVRATIQGIKAETLITAQPPAQTETDDRGIDSLSLDELRTLRELQAKVERARGG